MLYLSWAIRQLNLLDVRIVDIEGHPGIHAQYNLLNPFFQLLKRIADL